MRQSRYKSQIRPKHHDHRRKLYNYGAVPQKQKGTPIEIPLLIFVKQQYHKDILLIGKDSPCPNHRLTH